MIKERSTCRICEGELKEVLDLGEIYPSNFVTGDEILETAPLTLVQCQSCNLVQLKHTVELDSMYRQYWYRSGLNPSMVHDLQDIVNNIESGIRLNDGDVVVDIGCNDGTMLAMYSNDNLIKIGYDPALNLMETASKNCTYFINDYFPNGYKTIEGAGKAKVITSIAMFYDLEDPNVFVKAIKEYLHEDGAWIIQFTDLLSMFRVRAFDNICHEHLEYYSLKNIMDLLSKHDLEIVDIAGNKVNGGSVRIIVGHKGRWLVQNRVYTTLGFEEGYFSAFGNNSMKVFADQIESIKRTTLELLTTLKDQGKTIAIMGASTKGNTLLQYFGIDTNLIDHVAEINEDKFGLKTVGTNIPIISQEESLLRKPDYYLVLPWHFIDNILSRNDSYLNDGGAFIVPMPTPSVIGKREGELIWVVLDLL